MTVDGRSAVADPKVITKVACRLALGKDLDHHCPLCDAFQNVHHETNFQTGAHSHKCPNPTCGHVWWHGGPLGYPRSGR